MFGRVTARSPTKAFRISPGTFRDTRNHWRELPLLAVPLASCTLSLPANLTRFLQLEAYDVVNVVEKVAQHRLERQKVPEPDPRAVVVGHELRL